MKLSLLSLLFCGGAMTAVAAAAAVSVPQGVSFLTGEHVVWKGTSQVIPFRSAEVSADGVTPDFAADATFLEVLRPPETLAGEELGYLRIRGVRIGTSQLRVGDAVTRVHVCESPTETALHRPRVLITTPVNGAVVWGAFTVGVEVRGIARRPLPEDGEIRLLLSNGQALSPIRRPASPSPDLRATFEIDTESLSQGLLTLSAQLMGGGETVSSPAISVRVVRPHEQWLLTAECEELVGRENPTGFGNGRPTLGSLSDGGAFSVHTRAGRALVAPIRVNSPGSYQMMVVARGDLAAGTFPSIGFAVESRRNILTAGQVVDQRWHRIALGHPVRLGAGDHDFGLMFLNDRSISTTNDRNLYLDRFELLRIEEPGGELIEAGYRPGPALLSPESMIAGGAVESSERLIAQNGAFRFGSGGLSVALDRPLDGLPITGRVNIGGVCRWDGDIGAPEVDLVLNERTVLSQQAARPLFALDRASFAEGVNELYLRARLSDGRIATTPIQTLRVETPVETQVRDLYRFEVLDERFEASIKETFAAGRGNQQIARLPPGYELRLQLPEELAGEFQALFHAKGGRKPEGRISFQVHHQGDGTSTPEKPKSVAFRPYFSSRDAGSVRLRAGPKTLVIKRVDRGEEVDLQFSAAMLRRRREGADLQAPVTRLLYPPDGHATDAVDVCIVEAWDDDRLSQADVWIDGCPQGTFGFLAPGAGYAVLPLLTAGLSPGAHTVFVRAKDPHGNLGETREITIQVAARTEAEPGPYARAVHLLNRFAYGTDPAELARCLIMGEENWLRDRLMSMGVGDRTAIGAAEARLTSVSRGSVSRAALTHALRTDNPVRTRFCFWVENHFSTWIAKTRGPAEWSEHKRFLALGAAPFVELLWASATSPAMVHYLDQSQSFGSRLNENFAREILELHSLGVEGGYDQKDVTEMASLLAGLTLNEEALPNGQGGRGKYVAAQVLRYDPDLGDAREREILGLRFPEANPEKRFDRVRLAIELLAAHPSTAQHICRSLVEHYVVLPAPQPLVDDLAQVFASSGGDLGKVLLALSRHPLFWSESQPRVATPLDYAMRLARATGSVEIDGQVHNFLERSGMGIFRRETPDGYPEEDAAWVDTNALIQRRWIVEEIASTVRRLSPGALARTPVGDPRAWHERLIDTTAVRLLGWTLSTESRAAAIAFLDALEEPEDIPRELPLFIAQLPEANTR